MKLILFAALAALCGAAKLDHTYLPPVSAKTAGGTAGTLQTPLQGGELPAGGFVNDAQGVVVDAAATGTRASPGAEESGLGAPRPSYGSTASKVGDAAFRESVTGFSQIPNTFARIAPIPEHETAVGPVFGNQVFQSKTIIPQASNDYNANTLSYQNNVESHKYNYGFATDNGIAVGEKGISLDGIQAQGGYSYKGDDGKDYKVTYTADKEGYKPQGSHLPTPPPIPHDIVKSIEQNAKEEAAGNYGIGFNDDTPSTQFGQTSFGSQQTITQTQSQIAATGNKVPIPTQGSLFGKPQSSGNYESSVINYGQVGSSDGADNQKSQFGVSATPVFGSEAVGFGTQYSKGSSAIATASVSGTQPGKTLSSSQTSVGDKKQPQPAGFLAGFDESVGQISQTSNQFSSFNTQSAQKNQFGLSKSNEEFGSPAILHKAPCCGGNQAELKPLPSPSQAPVTSISSRLKPAQPEFSQGSQFVLKSNEEFGSSAILHKAPCCGGNQAELKPLPSPSPAPVTSISSRLKPAQPEFSQGSQFVLKSNEEFGSSAILHKAPCCGGNQAELKPLPSPSPAPVTSISSRLKPAQPEFSQGSQFGLKSNEEFGSTAILHKAPCCGGNQAELKPLPSPSPAPVTSISSRLKPAQPEFSQGSQFGLKSNEEFGSPAILHKAPCCGGNQAELKPLPSPSPAPVTSISSRLKPAQPEFSQGSQFGLKSNEEFGSPAILHKAPCCGGNQAELKPLPSPFPALVTSFPSRLKPVQPEFSQGSQFGQKSSTLQQQSSFGLTNSFASISGQKTPVNSQNAPSVSTPQYTGQLYEYNKPDQGISATTPSSTLSTGSLGSSQFGQASFGSIPESKPQFGFNQGSQINSPFGNKQQGFQKTQLNTQSTQSQTSFGSQSYKPFGTQFGSEAIKPQFGQTSQSSFTQTQAQQSVKPLGSSSQFGISGTTPQFGSQTFQSSSQQSTQQSTQGNKLLNVYLPPISLTSTLGVQGAKPQYGQDSKPSQSSGTQQSTQVTQESVGSVTQQTQDSGSQFGSQSSKPFGTTSQIGTQGYKPQFGQTSQSQEGGFQQTQQTVGSITQPGQGSFGSYKPFGSSQFGTQGTIPTPSKSGAVPQKSQGNTFPQTQTTSQIVETQQVAQGSQLGSQPSKPFGTTQFGIQESKPQPGQLSQTQQSTFTQTQTTQQAVGVAQQQPTFGSQSQFGSQSNKPISSQLDTQETKPQFGQVSSTQTTQQTLGSVISTQQQTQPQYVYLPSKPLTPTSQFGQVSTSQGGSFQQTTQTNQPTVGSLGLTGGQPSKPFETTSQIGTQDIKPGDSSITQTQTIQQIDSSLTQQQSEQGSQVFVSQPSKPFGTTSQFGIQGTKPQGSAFTQTTQQSGSTLTQQQSGQGSQSFGSQPSTAFGTSSQFGTQGTKPQGSAFTQTTQQSGSTLNQQQSGQGSQVFGSQVSKPVGAPSQLSQGTLTQIQTTQQSTGVLSGTQQGSQTQFGSQFSKPFGASQIGTQGSKPQSGQTQTSQQSFTQSQFNQQPSYNKLGQLKPFTTSFPATFSSGFSKQPAKTQFGSSSQKTQSATGATGSKFGSQFSQGSSQIGVQPFKPFSTSQAPSKPAFGQSLTPFTNNQNSQTQSGYQYKPPVNGFGKYQPKPQFGSGFTGFSSSQASSSATTFPQAFKGTQFGSQFKPFGTQLQPFKTQFGQTPVSSASAFASSSSTASPVSKFTFQPLKPFGSSSTVFPTSSTPLASKPNLGFSKPCCQASKFGQSSTTASPTVSTTLDLQGLGSTQKTEVFSGPQQPQKFDEKTGYYY